MPIYEYRCSSCGADHEALQKLSDPLLVTCPSCHKDALVKQLSAAGFQLKGSGWYVTDFRNGSKPAAKTDAKSDETTGEKTGEKAGEKADAKPAPADGARTDSAAKPAEAAAESKSQASTPAPAATKPTGTA
ncbi:MAG: FmdB family zinc ribbon protein [Casimicrobiaceae bacterium]